jgi:hypothetical protein
MPNPRSKCTVGLLALASQAIYRVKKDNIIDPTYSKMYAQTLIDIDKHGYAITKAIVPKSSKGTGETPLGALCMMPRDNESPIVIAFRGTKSRSDYGSDVRLGVTGTVEKAFRDSALEFYQKIRKENPDREIILTGHSLGGHIATYVATKAYNTDPDLVANPLLQVRNFNPAPVKSKHLSVLKNHPHLHSLFVNYRLSSDVVSDLPLQKYTGNTFVFPCNKRSWASHSMQAITTFIPQEVQDQTVGTSQDGSKKFHQLLELYQGVLQSYQSRVEGQYFSRYRAGAKNLAEMQKILPQLIKLLEKGYYDDVVHGLDALKEKMNGSVSKRMVEVLMQSTINVKSHHMMEVANYEPPVIKHNGGIKSKLQAMKNEDGGETPEPTSKIS